MAPRAQRSTTSQPWLLAALVGGALCTGCVSTTRPTDASRNARNSDDPVLPLAYDPTTGGSETFATGSTSGSGVPARTEDRRRTPEAGTGTDDHTPVVRISPAGDRSSRESSGNGERPLIDVRPINGARSNPTGHPTEEPKGDPLVDIQRRTLTQLQALITPGRPLRIQEQLAMEGLVVTLIALHDLGVGDLDEYRGPLLSAVETIDAPRPGFRHRIAAFYHDLGLDDLADRLMATNRESSATSDDKRSDEEGELTFRVNDLTPEKISRDGKEREYDPDDLRPRDELYLLADLENLTSRPAKGGIEYKYSVEAFLYNENDDYQDQQWLERNKTQFTQFERSVIRINYEIPSRYNPGNYRLELKITDEFAEQQDLASIPIRIRARR